MLSRRNFLKLSGLGAVAVGSGFGAGKLVQNSKTEIYRVQAFLPDVESASELTKIISRKVKFSGMPVFNGELKNLLAKNYSQENYNEATAKMTFRIEKLENNFNGDILVSDNRISIYDPVEDFNGSLLQLRSVVRNRKANYIFSAEYRNENIFASLLNNGKKVAVIENESGIFDQISLSESYKKILIKGPSGSTSLVMDNGSVHINSSCCRNGICSKSGRISEPNELIACAPNKILIRIESV
jgi:hypothetical protein